MIQVLPSLSSDEQKVISPECLAFVEQLHKTFNSTRKELLLKRSIRFQKQDFPMFLPETKNIREAEWSAAPPAPGMIDRRVEITGPVDRKMVINALNCGATQFMADFEDATSPFFSSIVQGHVNLTDAVHQTIQYTNENGKKYFLNDKTATLLVRPRGWHMEEKHVLIDGEPCSASLFDFGVYFFNNAKKSISNGKGPYFYLPKLEHYLEARLWNDVFNLSQDILLINRGTIRATVLIETILAAYQMDEIIYELKSHSSGLNCGRWDYIFSVIKYFRNKKEFILPDRKDVTMSVPFMESYVKLLIKTCHKRGVHAMGGMAAQIPVKDDVKANEAALVKVKNDKIREVLAGHDGSWVAHPALVNVCKQVFDEYMPQPNQLHKRFDYSISESDLINMNVNGYVTIEGVTENIFVALSYLSGWLSGKGAVPINNLMEDAATVEISRSQLWAWIRHGVMMRDGRVVTKRLVDELIEVEFNKMTPSKELTKAKYLLIAMTTGKEDVVEVDKCERIREMIGFPLFVTDVCGWEILDNTVVMRFLTKL
eukprot:NODE_231_length_13709_cov_0.444526.p2 type:complete len:541 gc:universal NODE_231_length_13709_cov_0.444526:401-2023(+)